MACRDLVMTGFFWMGPGDLFGVLEAGTRPSESSFRFPSEDVEAEMGVVTLMRGRRDLGVPASPREQAER